jgi:hypothetical protein
MNESVKPQKITFPTPDGPLTIHAADHIRRLDGLERLAETTGVQVAAVWGVIHFSESQGRRLHAGAARIDGQPQVWIAINRAQCPIIRLALLAHELRHVERGDLDQLSVYDEAEGDADAAAEHAIQSWAAVVTNTAATNVNPAACVRCYHGAHYPCSQGPDVFEAVRTRLHRY